MSSKILRTASRRSILGLVILDLGLVIGTSGRPRTTP